MKIPPFSKFKIFLISIFCFLLALPAKSQQPVLHTNLGHWSDNLAISNDGKYFASGFVQGEVKIWDIESLRELKSFNCGGRVEGLAFSENGKELIVHCEESFKSVLRTYSVLTGLEVSKFPTKGTTLGFSKIDPLKQRFIVEGYKATFVYNYQTQKKLATIPTGEYEELKAISYDADLFALFLNGTITYYSIDNGKKIRSCSLPDGITAISIAPDKKQLIIGLTDGSISLCSVENGIAIRSKKLFTEPIKSIDFSPEGKYILASSESKVMLLKSIDFAEVNTLESGKYAFSRNEDILIVGSREKYSILNINDLIIKTIPIKASFIYAFDYSPDGKSLILGGNDGFLRVWDLSGKGQFKMLKAHQNSILSVTSLNDKRSFITCGQDRVFKIWDANTLEVTKTINPKEQYGQGFEFNVQKSAKLILVNGFLLDVSKEEMSPLSSTLNNAPTNLNFSFSNNGNYVASYSQETKTISVIDINSSKVVSAIPSEDKFLFNLKFSPDDKLIAACNAEKSISIFDVESKKRIAKIKLDWGLIDKFTFNNSGSTIIADIFEFGREALVFIDVKQNKVIRTIEIDREYAGVLKFSPDDKFLIYAGISGRVHYVDAETGIEKLSLIGIVGTSDWAAVSPDGHFEGSENGFNYLHFVNGLDIIPLQSLFEQYYTPGLILQTLSGFMPEKTSVNIAQLSLPPEVRILSPENNSALQNSEVKITVQANDKGGGVDEIKIFHNGKMIQTTQRGFKATGQKQDFVITLVDGENRIKATAFSSQRVEAVPCEIMVKFKAPTQTKPNMYILAIGINNYLNPKYNLNYARNDAEAFVQSLKIGATPLFGKVDVNTISDENATRDGIISAINKVTLSSKPEDVFVLYYAGHGVMSSGSETDKSQFYLVPHNVTKMYEADDMLKKSGISATEIGEFSKNIKAQKQLFVIDACQSGGAMQTLAMRGASEEKAIAQLARSTGTYFIAASGSKQFATEVAELGHGVFTYSVIEALKGLCKSQDGKVTVNLLKSCVEDLVPELSKKHKGQPQFPTGYGFGQDFPIGIVK